MSDIDRYRYQVSQVILSGNIDAAIKLMAEQEKSHPGSVVLNELKFSVPITFALGKLSAILFKRCEFNGLTIKDCEISRLSFTGCTFRGDLSFQNFSHIGELAIQQNDGRLDTLTINGKHQRINATTGHSENCVGRIDNLTYEARLERPVQKISLECVHIKTLSPTLVPASTLEMDAFIYDGDKSDLLYNVSGNVTWNLHDCEFNSKFSTGDNATKKNIKISNSKFKNGLSLKHVTFLSPLLITDCTIGGDGLDIIGGSIPDDSKITGDFSDFSISAASLYGYLEVVGSRDKEGNSIKISPNDFGAGTLKLSNFKTKSLKINNNAAYDKLIHYTSLTLEDIDVTESFEVRSSTVNDSLQFNRVTLKRSLFSHCKFLGPTEFNDCQFEKAPRFNHCDFFYDTSFQSSLFLDMGKSEAGAYRQLKNKMAESNNDAEETRFAAYETRSKRKRLAKREWFERSLSFLYLWINGCGESILRPFLLILALFVFFLFLYFGLDTFHVEIPLPLTNPWHNDLFKWGFFWQSVTYSFINSLGPLRLLIPGGIFIPTSMCGLFIATAHIILGSVLWFFLVFGIRRRFKMT